MLLARHHFAWKEMTNADIGHEGLVVDVLRRGVELGADIVASEASRWRSNHTRARTGIDAIVGGGHVQRSALEQHQEVPVRCQLQAQTALLDVLKAEQVDQAEGIVVTRILLVVSPDAIGIPVRITGRVVVLGLEVWLPWQAFGSVAATDDCRACMN